MPTFRMFKDQQGNVVAFSNDQLFQHYFGILMSERRRIKQEGGSTNDFVVNYHAMFNTIEKQTISGFLRGRLHLTGSVNEMLGQFFEMRVLGEND